MYTPDNAIDPSLRPTQETYDGFQWAYEHFNWQLFDSQLPNCLITLQRKSRSFGYFSPKRFVRVDGRATHEIALNPSHFSTRPLKETLSTLVHEQVHLWQGCFGTPSRAGYHNREWAEQMKRIGLHPSATGKPGGREVGDRMSHFIIVGGPFCRAATGLLESGFRIEWQERETVSTREGSVASGLRELSRGGKRVTYVCPVCGVSAQSRRNANILCGDHRCRMHPRETGSPHLT